MSIWWSSRFSWVTMDRRVHSIVNLATEVNVSLKSQPGTCEKPLATIQDLCWMKSPLLSCLLWNTMWLPVALRFAGICSTHSKVPVFFNWSYSFLREFSHCFESGDLMASQYVRGSFPTMMKAHWPSSLVIAAFILSSVAAVPNCTAGFHVQIGWSLGGRSFHWDECFIGCGSDVGEDWFSGMSYSVLVSVRSDGAWVASGLSFIISDAPTGTNLSVSSREGVVPHVSMTVLSLEWGLPQIIHPLLLSTSLSWCLLTCNP